MATSAFISLLDDATEQFVTETVDMLDSVYDEILDDEGGTYGDVKMSRGERIAEVVDYATRGVMDALRMRCEAYGARWYREMHEQFLKDIEASPLEQRV